MSDKPSNSAIAGSAALHCRVVITASAHNRPPAIVRASPQEFLEDWQNSKPM
jgi:hypothetical protein